MPDYQGLLFIGDPHLASRNPGSRKDDYPRRILRKLEWCLELAAEQNLLPCLLGDLFHMPRDNANWLVGEVCRLFRDREVLAIYGNHDCRENALGEDDTLMILIRAGLLTLVSERAPWRGTIRGHRVIVGGTSYGDALPTMRTFLEGVGRDSIVFWMAHHDVMSADKIGPMHVQPVEVAGVDVVVNGHIHHALPEERHGKTAWITPGNIARVNRSAKRHEPQVLEAWVEDGQPEWRMVRVPHEPSVDVFHEAILDEPSVDTESLFVQGLAELQARRTATGEGLQQFLEKNLAQFEPLIQNEIWKLSKEVTHAE